MLMYFWTFSRWSFTMVTWWAADVAQLELADALALTFFVLLFCILCVSVNDQILLSQCYQTIRQTPCSNCWLFMCPGTAPLKNPLGFFLKIVKKGKLGVLALEILMLRYIDIQLDLALMQLHQPEWCSFSNLALEKKAKSFFPKVLNFSIFHLLKNNICWVLLFLFLFFHSLFHCLVHKEILLVGNEILIQTVVVSHGLLFFA